MPRPVAAAQRAVQVTFILKGHLKNAQISYLRAAALLATVRDEKLWAALRHPDIESYAAARLGLGRASLYRYLQIHDWVRRRSLKSSRGWPTPSGSSATPRSSAERRRRPTAGTVTARSSGA